MEQQTAGEAFDAVVAEYDSWIRQALPTYEELFSVAVELIPYPRDTAIEVADLGAGTGLFSERVVRSFSRARFTLYDAAPGMLETARRRFESQPGRVQLREERLERFAAPAAFDLLISSLAIHHLEHADKRSLFQRTFAALRPGGAFILVDQVRGEAPFGELYWSTWLAKVRRSGAPEPRIQASIERRRQFDRDASAEQQLQWLREAGFAADCIYKRYFVAVFLGLRSD